jgi:hypothetical protein
VHAKWTYRLVVGHPAGPVRWAQEVNAGKAVRLGDDAEERVDCKGYGRNIASHPRTECQNRPFSNGVVLRSSTLSFNAIKAFHWRLVRLTYKWLGVPDRLLRRLGATVQRCEPLPS